MIVPFFKTFSLSFLMCSLEICETSTGNRTGLWERNLQYTFATLIVSCLQLQLFSRVDFLSHNFLPCSSKIIIFLKIKNQTNYHKSHLFCSDNLICLGHKLPLAIAYVLVKSLEHKFECCLVLSMLKKFI